MLEKELKQSSPTRLSTSTFVDSHANASLASRKCSPLSLPSNALEDINAPAAMPGKNIPHPLVQTQSNDTTQADKSWEEAIAQFCMPKGALLPLAPPLSSGNQDTLPSTGVSSSGPSNGAFSDPHEEASTSSTAAEGPVSSTSLSFDSIDGTSSAFTSVLNVPDTMVPMLPQELRNSPIDSRHNRRFSTSVGFPDSATATTISTSTSHTTSNASSSPTTTMSSSRTSHISPGETTPNSNQLVQSVGDLSVGDQSVFALPTSVFSDSFEQFSNVYSQAFSPLAGPTASLRRIPSPPHPASQPPVSANSTKAVATLPEPPRRLSIVNIPRRSSGTGSAGTTPGQGQIVGGTSQDRENIFHLPTLPSLTNLRIHTSTIRGRRQQKKNNTNSLAASSSVNQVVLPTDNALGLALQAEVTSSKTARNDTDLTSPTDCSDAATHPSDRFDMTDVNVPGAPNFQPSAASSMMLQPMPYHTPTYSHYGQNPSAKAPLPLQMHNFPLYAYAYAHPQQSEIPVSPEEDSYKLSKGASAQVAPPMPESAIFLQYSNVPQAHHRLYGSYAGAFNQSARTVPTNTSSQPFSLNAPTYPASVSYAQGQFYPTHPQPQHQWSQNALYHPSNVPQIIAQKRSASFANAQNYTHTAPVHGSIAQVQLQMGGMIPKNQESVPRFTNLSQPCFQNSYGHPNISAPHPSHPPSTLESSKAANASEPDEAASLNEQTSHQHQQPPFKKARVN